MIWLGSRRGHLSDWVTQQWVRLTGRRVDFSVEPWLAGPIASTRGIGPDYFTSLAEKEGLELKAAGGADDVIGIVPDFTALRGPSFEPTSVDRGVIRFYEETSAYELDAWAEWCGAFRPFGRLLAVLFSRRLQQLNVPLSGLDTSAGMTSEVLCFVHPMNAGRRLTAWFRRLRSSGNVLYAGFYSVCALPGHSDPVVKVAFPLPNGNAIVIMRTESRADGSFVVTSAGERFGEPGFYFTVRGDADHGWVRYVRSLRESIHVFPAEGGIVRADHILTYFGATFLRLHYRMQRTLP